MKIVAIVQARMGSERLKGKVIKEIMGKPIILHVLDRLSKSKFVNEVALATSMKEEEKPLVDIVKKAGYVVYRGSENDVMERYIKCNENMNGDIILRITGDCPLIDWNIIDNVITYFNINNFDYVRLDVPNTVIRGFDVEIFTKEALQKSCEMTIEKNEENLTYREHVTLYMYRHPKEFRIGVVQGSDLYNRNYRLCVDTREDYEVVKNIYEHFNYEYIEAKKVIDYVDNNKDIGRINCNIIQKHV